MSGQPLLELESIEDMSDFQRQGVPPEDTRLTRRVGDTVRVLVLVNGAEHCAIWLRITEVNRPNYVGVFYGVEDYGPIALGTTFEFTADHIIDY